MNARKRGNVYLVPANLELAAVVSAESLVEVGPDHPDYPLWDEWWVATHGRMARRGLRLVRSRHG